MPHSTGRTDTPRAGSLSQQQSARYRENAAIKKPPPYRTQLADKSKETANTLRKRQLWRAWKLRATTRAAGGEAAARAGRACEGLARDGSSDGTFATGRGAPHTGEAAAAGLGPPPSARPELGAAAAPRQTAAIPSRRAWRPRCRKARGQLHLEGKHHPGCQNGTTASPRAVPPGRSARSGRCPGPRPRAGPPAGGAGRSRLTLRQA